MTGDGPVALARRAAEALVGALGRAPEAAVVLGTGLSGVADRMGPTSAEVDLGSLPGSPPFSAPGHRPVARLVSVGDRPVLVLLGRVHLYEGRTAAEVTHWVRSAVLAGSRTVVLTNAAGALRPEWAVGALVLITDHIDGTGAPGPLVGLGPGPTSPSAVPGEPPPGGAPATPSVFVDLTETWSARLRAVARDRRPDLASGVYVQLRGPQFETPAEIAMWRTLGADLVGMSTVKEAVAARHLGAELLGVSVVTNLAAGLGHAVSANDVTSAAAAAGPVLGDLIRDVLTRC